MKHEIAQIIMDTIYIYCECLHTSYITHLSKGEQHLIIHFTNNKKQQNKHTNSMYNKSVLNFYQYFRTNTNKNKFKKNKMYEYYYDDDDNEDEGEE